MKKTKLAISIALASACFTSTHALANTITGQVVDGKGVPVVNGSVQIMGSNKRSLLDENGRFLFENVKAGNFELHVSSSSHIHSSEKVSVVDNETSELSIKVAKSSIEVFDVTASAFHASNIESAAPVSILAGERLKQQQAATLGETLKNQVGVHSSFYGGVTSSPIIRGLDGPRVLITQNGMDAADASRVGPDHLVSTESSTVQQIEVLRGPATLFYGSGAIGGVVNLVDTRIPEDNLTEGEVSLSRNSSDSQEAFSGTFKTGVDNIAFQMQGFYRDSDDYGIPGYAESESAHNDHDDHGDEEHEGNDDEHEEGSFGRVENSAARTQGITLGTSYLFEAGHLGFSVEHLSSVYGIPGHSHGGEHDDEHDEGALVDGVMSLEDEVKAELNQNRYQLAGEFQLSTDLISAINFGLAYTDYEHTEIEGGVPGTRFTNELFETRMEILHQPIAGWRGGISLHTKMSDFAAVGEEAFTPPSDTKSFGLGIIEERHFGDFLVQIGGRIERVQIAVPVVFEPEISFIDEMYDDHEGDHDEHDGDHNDHDDGHSEHDHMSAPVNLDFTPLSLSAGVVWDIADGYNFAVSYVHAQRAPSSAELFSFGPHIGTQTYEIGALYELESEDDGMHIEFHPTTPAMEKSNNIDISWRKFGGDFGAVVNIFYNQVDDYYFTSNTGFEAELSHDHDDEHDVHDNHEEHGEHAEHEEDEEHSEEGLPVFAYTADDADLYGAEVQFTWQALESLTLTAQGDFIRARVNNRGTVNLPRIPPVKLLFGADYKTKDMTISAQVTHMMKQSDIAEFESQTNAYTLVDVNASYFTTMKGIDAEWYLRGRNLTDEDARVHTSFLKDLAPLPGRSVELGLRMRF